jgi:TatD DNase family protein
VIFDTHCHAYWRGLENREDEVRANMSAAGVRGSIQIGADIESSRIALDTAIRWGSDTWCTVGIHPSDCQNLPVDSCETIILELERLRESRIDKVVGIGETGLDYHHLTPGKESSQKETQSAFFAAQTRLAQRLELPLVIHTRDAAADTVRLIKENNVRRAVIHCFSEDSRFAEELMNWSEDIYFSFSGILTYRNARSIQDAAIYLPLDRILVETDSPFLVPAGARNERGVNEPAFTRYVLDFLKTLRAEPPEIVEETVWKNSHAFFNIPKFDAHLLAEVTGSVL